MYITGHLEELRRRLLVAGGAVLLFSFIGYAVSRPALDFLLSPARETFGELYFFSPQDAFLARFRISLFIGLLSGSPVVFTQFWLFVSPALYPSEKRLILPLILATTGLFAAGCLFAYFAVVPFTLRFFAGFQTETLRPLISVSHYVEFVSSLVLSFGAGFNLPVFLAALSALGLVDSAFLRRYRRHAVVLIFILAAVLTPPDVFSQVILALPLLGLYELGVLGVRVFERKRKPEGMLQ